MSVKKAVFPVAGFGTRFLPATKATPKEMLPIVDKPIVQYAVEEAYEAGIREFIFITHHAKRAIEDHFDQNKELHEKLINDKKLELAKSIEKIGGAEIKFTYIRPLFLRVLNATDFFDFCLKLSRSNTAILQILDIFFQFCHLWKLIKLSAPSKKNNSFFLFFCLKYFIRL